MRFAVSIEHLVVFVADCDRHSLVSHVVHKRGVPLVLLLIAVWVHMLLVIVLRLLLLLHVLHMLLILKLLLLVVTSATHFDDIFQLFIYLYLRV